MWDFLTDEQAVQVVSQCDKAGRRHESAKAIVDRVMELAAEESGMTVEELKNLPAGRARRSRHDDTTVVVMYF